MKWNKANEINIPIRTSKLCRIINNKEIDYKLNELFHGQYYSDSEVYDIDHSTWVNNDNVEWLDEFDNLSSSFKIIHIESGLFFNGGMWANSNLIRYLNTNDNPYWKQAFSKNGKMWNDLNGLNACLNQYKNNSYFSIMYNFLQNECEIIEFQNKVIAMNKIKFENEKD